MQVGIGFEEKLDSPGVESIRWEFVRICFLVGDGG